MLLFICFLTALFSSETPPIEYSFSFQQIEQNQLNVTCTFTGSSTGTTQLRLPHQWAGHKDLEKNIHNLSCAKHSLLPTEHPHTQQVIHKPNEKLTVTYSVGLQATTTSDAMCYRPIGNRDYFYTHGHGLFVLPGNEEKISPITLNWTDLPEKWKIINSFAAEKSLQRLDLMPSELLGATFMAGQIDIVSSGDTHHPLFMATYGKWPFSTDEIQNLTQQIVESQRNFWNDHDFPYFFISLLSIDTHNSIGGTALHNNLSLFLGKADYAKEEWLDLLAWLISHEHFHTWNGGKISSSEPEGSMYWFSEGFTEYYSLKLNNRAKIISDATYQQEIDKHLKKYFDSPARNASNQEIVEKFWTDQEIQELPYNRGFAIALYIDKAIHKHDPTKSLDNFMHDLFAMTKTRPYTTQDLITLMHHYLPQDTITQLTDTILVGKLIVF